MMYYNTRYDPFLLMIPAECKVFLHTQISLVSIVFLNSNSFVYIVSIFYMHLRITGMHSTHTVDTFYQIFV